MAGEEVRLFSFMAPGRGHERFRGDAAAEDTRIACIQLSRLIHARLVEYAQDEYVVSPPGIVKRFTRHAKLFLPEARLNVLQGSAPATDFAIALEHRHGAHLYSGTGQIGSGALPEVRRFDFRLSRFHEIVTDPMFDTARYTDVLIAEHRRISMGLGEVAIGEREATGIGACVELASPRFRMYDVGGFLPTH